jgi:hypothetical protein
MRVNMSSPTAYCTAADWIARFADRKLAFKLAGHVWTINPCRWSHNILCAMLCNRLMPKADVGDFVVVADTGAYTLSMYSRYAGRLHLTLERWQLACQADVLFSGGTAGSSQPGSLQKGPANGFVVHLS